MLHVFQLLFYFYLKYFLIKLIRTYEVDKGFNMLSRKSSLIKFKESERFKSNVVETPGPGSYNTQFSFLK